jgi:hypothetical protein
MQPEFEFCSNTSQFGVAPSVHQRALDMSGSHSHPTGWKATDEPAATFPGHFEGIDASVCQGRIMERRESCSSGGRTPTGPFMHPHQQDPMLGKIVYVVYTCIYIYKCNKMLGVA